MSMYVAPAGQNSYQVSNYPQNQQQVYAPRRQSKAEVYAKTAARGFVIGSAIDAMFQVLGPPIRKVFSNEAGKAVIDAHKKAGHYKFQPGRMAATGVLWALMDIGFRAFYGRD